MEIVIPFVLIVSVLVAIGFLIGLFGKRYVFPDKKVAELKRLVKALKRDATQGSIAEWLAQIGQTSYRNEIEVEVKFINPLLWFLGYESDDFQLRVPIAIYVGRQQVAGVADWVIWDKETGKATTIIEAKEPGQPLDETVQAQARSYAFALKAPMYLLTNGCELRIYRRGIQDDSCVFDCNVNNLSHRWEELNDILGADVCPKDSENIGDNKLKSAVERERL